MKIKNTEKFSKIIGTELNQNEESKLSKALNDFPTTVNERMIQLAKSSNPIFQQVIATPIEGESITEERVYKPRIFPVRGIERAYSGRLIITPVYDCEAFCRYCFMRESGLGQKPATPEEIDAALDYVNTNEDLKYVLITGGDPMISRSRLEKLMLGLKDIPHIESIRIGTRSILFNPSKFDDHFFDLVTEARSNKKRVEIGAHMNHPDEIDSEASNCIEKLTENHVTVYTQTVLLKGINDDATTLKELYEKVYHRGAEIYLLFHCDPISGSDHLRTKISKGLEIKRELADLTSGRLTPHYKVAKCEIGVDSEVINKTADSIQIKTPYSIEKLEKNIENFKINKPLESVSDDGRLVVTYFGEW